MKKLGGQLKGVLSKTPIGMAANLAKGAAKCKGNPKCVANEAKKTAKAAVANTKEMSKMVYKYSGAQQLVQSGKALSKCKPKDAKCIAKNLADMAMAAKGLTPAGLASTMAKNVIKEQLKKKFEAEKAKRAAQKKLSEAKTSEERLLATREIQAADQNIAAVEATVEANQKIIAQGDAEKMVALQELEKAKLDPTTAKQAAQVEQQALHPEEPVKPIVFNDGNGEKKIFGMPQMKFAMIAGGIAFFILLLIILLK